MDQITLAGTNLTAGRIVFGTMTFGAQVDEAEAAQMVQVCRDAGITMFDTANNYAGGRSEEILGRIVKPFRGEVILATKGGNDVEQEGDSLRGLGRETVRKAIDGSLKRLGTDYIDVYYLHRPDRNTPIEETLLALSEAVEAGKIRHIGQSNFAAWQITQMICLARTNGWPVPLISQPLYNLLARRVEAEYEEAARVLGLTNIIYNPLAGGLLTGKHRPSDQPEPGTRFTKDTYRNRYWNDAQFTAVERLRAIAEGAGLTLVELAFRWVLGRDLTGGMLLGASRLEQLTTNLAAIDRPALSSEVLDACDDVWTELLSGAGPRYNR